MWMCVRENRNIAIYRWGSSMCGRRIRRGEEGKETIIITAARATENNNYTYQVYNTTTYSPKTSQRTVRDIKIIKLKHQQNHHHHEHQQWQRQQQTTHV